MKSFLLKLLVTGIGSTYGSLLFLFTTDYSNKNIYIAIESWLFGTSVGLISLLMIDLISILLKKRQHQIVKFNKFWKK